MKRASQNRLIIRAGVDTTIPIIARTLLPLFVQRQIIPAINAPRLLQSGIPNLPICPQEIQMNTTAIKAKIADNKP